MRGFVAAADSELIFQIDEEGFSTGDFGDVLQLPGVFTLFLMRAKNNDQTN